MLSPVGVHAHVPLYRSCVHEICTPGHSSVSHAHPWCFPWNSCSAQTLAWLCRPKQHSPSQDPPGSRLSLQFCLLTFQTVSSHLQEIRVTTIAAQSRQRFPRSLKILTLRTTL